jgi:hypothetical protein
MVIIRVLIVELLCLVVTEQIPALECLLLGVRKSQWLCLVLCGFKWPCHPGNPALESLAQYWRRSSVATGGSGAC